MFCIISPLPTARQTGGFGLVEIAIALGIVSFSLLALMGLTAVGLSSSKSAREDTVVASLARNVFSSLKTQDYTNLSTLGTTNCYFTYDGVVTNSTATSAYYACTTRVLTPSQATLNRSRNIVLDFSWPYRAGKTNGATFSSSIAEY